MDEVISLPNMINNKSYKISDIFEFVGRGKRMILKQNEGKYPLISASSENNGVVKYIDGFDFDGEEIGLVTCSIGCIGGDGCFTYHNDKFACTNHIIVLKPKQCISNITEICSAISAQLMSKFSSSYNLTKDKLMDEVILLPNMINNNTYKISDIFEFVGRGKHQVGNKENTGSYPLISTTDKNNGVIKCIETYDYESTEENKLITVSMNGQPGVMFLQNGKFSCTSDVSVLKVINSNFQNEWCTIISTQLTPKYSWSYKLTKDKLMDEIVNIPTNII
jgi:hypothetical protein